MITFQICRLHVVYEDGTYQLLQLGWDINKSEGTSSSDLGFVAVVDGKKVKMTPFRQTVIPPPMSAFEVHVPEQIQQVILNKPRPRKRLKLP